jgi:hypothetical protein
MPISNDILSSTLRILLDQETDNLFQSRSSARPNEKAGRCRIL